MSYICQSAIESQRNPSPNPKTSPTMPQPPALIDTSLNHKFHSHASSPSRNSLSQAAVISELNSKPKCNNHKVDDDILTQAEATTSNHNKLSSTTLSKKQHRAAAGVGLPSSNTGSVQIKQNLTTSGAPSRTSQKKNKTDTEAESKNIQDGSIPAKTLRCHQCRAEVPLENVIQCSNADNARSKNRRKRSEPIQKPLINTSSTSSPKIPSSSLGPCRINFCGRCLSARYGEDLKKVRPEVNTPYKWDCPVCQDYCNCSICRKKKGLPPTGKLSKAAIEAGFTSARELLAVDPHAQGPEILNQEANRHGKEKEQPTSAPHQQKAPFDVLNKKFLKLKNPESLAPKSKKLTNKLITKNPNHKKKMCSQDLKHLEAVKKLKKQQQVENPKAGKAGASSSKQPSLLSQPAATLFVSGGKATEQIAGVINKVTTRRAPHVVQAPTSYSCLPTGILGSGQILKRLHVREFICRFKDLIPGLGGTEAENSKAESQRADKIIDSMDDPVNFWIDDEGGMRAILNGLVRLIESDFSTDGQSSERGSLILKSPESPALLAQLKRESKNSIAPVPYNQTSVPCWLTATRILKEEGLESLLERDTENPYISPHNGSPSNEHSNDERLQKVKFPPVKKLAIISGLIDIALRGHTFCEDLTQGLERERQAKADILKEKAKLNKKWPETKAKKVFLMPSKKSLLVTSDNRRFQKPSQALVDQETTRIQALVEWEADMNLAELAHKNELRMLMVEQYKVESLNRLRFHSIGQDWHNNTYYILSSTPGRLYPNDPVELDFAWSYSLIIHGSEPANTPVKKGKRKSQQQKKAQGVTTTPNDPSMVPKDNEKDGTQIDMLEGGQRAPNDQWIRISDPKQIRQLVSWIEYEARLADFKNSTSWPASNGMSNKTTPDGSFKQTTTQAKRSSAVNDGAQSSNGGPNNNFFKGVVNLVDQINHFAEFLDLKISEHLELSQNDRRGLKPRHHS